MEVREALAGQFVCQDVENSPSLGDKKGIQEKFHNYGGSVKLMHFLPL